VVFVQRQNKQSRAETLGAIKAKIDQGWLVFLFPEGTTKGELRTTEFKIGGFNLAAANGYTIWPVAIEFDEPDNYWVNDDLFIPHLFRQLCRKEMHMHVWYGPAMTGNDGHALMMRCRNWIDEQLDAFRDSRKH
jgi:1-acyl-sn-glycerol-3-phosphate acyltransferase